MNRTLTRFKKPAALIGSLAVLVALGWWRWRDVSSASAPAVSDITPAPQPSPAAPRVAERTTSTAVVHNPASPPESPRSHFTQWAKSNGAAAMAAAQALPEAERSMEILAAILREWAAKDPVAAFQWLATSKPEDFPSLAPALAGALGREQPEAIVDLLRIIPDETARTSLATHLVQQWVESNTLFAANVALGLAGEASPIDLLGDILPHWGRRDLGRAVEWAKKIPHEASQSKALLHLSYAWVEADPRAAAEFAGRLGATHDQFIAVVASQWGRQNPAAAAQWAQELPAGPTRDRALTSVATAWAAADARAAADFVLKLPPGPVQENAVISVVSALANSDPSAAAQWAASFPSGRQRDYALENVFYAWTQTDAVAAVAWLVRLPPGADRATAIHAGAGSLVDTHPDLAAQLAAEISDEGLRTRQMERAARAWLATDPKSARAWIAQSNLPPQIKRTLLSPQS